MAAFAYMQPRMDTPKRPMDERIVYTDSAGKSEIIASLRITPEPVVASDRLDSVRAPETGHKRRRTSGKTCYIYGFEVLAVLAILPEMVNELRNRPATFYIDDNNVISALIKSAANPPEIHAMRG